MKSIIQWIEFARAHGYSFADKMEAEYRAYLERENIKKDTGLYSCLSVAMFGAFPWNGAENPDYWPDQYSGVYYQEQKSAGASASLN